MSLQTADNYNGPTLLASTFNHTALMSSSLSLISMWPNHVNHVGHEMCAFTKVDEIFKTCEKDEKTCNARKKMYF